jgi:hypothetical protein
MMDGHRCGCVALNGKSYCHFHNRYYVRNTPADPGYEIPVFDDSRSILLGIRQLLQADLSGQLDSSQVMRLLYAYRIAASIVRRPDGMSPESLRQWEKHQAAMLAAKAQARAQSRAELAEKTRPSRKTAEAAAGKEKATGETGDDFCDGLIATFEEMSGEKIGADTSHLPPGQRPSKLDLIMNFFDTETKPAPAKQSPETETAKAADKAADRAPDKVADRAADKDVL